MSPDNPQPMPVVSSSSTDVFHEVKVRPISAHRQHGLNRTLTYVRPILQEWLPSTGLLLLLVVVFTNAKTEEMQECALLAMAVVILVTLVCFAWKTRSDPK